VTSEIPEHDPDIANATPGQKNQLSLLSHDLRSALGDILGGLSLISREGLTPETHLQFDRIEAAAEVAARLLDKSRTDDPLEVRHPISCAVNTNLAEFLADIKKRWGAHASGKEVQFDIELAPSLPAIVTIDRVTLERVLANLIENALKYTDKGQVTLSISCDSARALVFSVTDNGPGFSPDALERLFRYRGRPKDAKKPGSGLGLFIAKEFSEVMSAQLEVGNAEGGGARAVLRLPHDRWFDRRPRRAADGARTSPPDSVDLSGLHILLAEDNKTNQLVATQMLQVMGASYAVASDGLEALEILERDSFDIALLDIEMPRMTGIELIRTIRRRSGPVSRMPLVALTAYVMREHRERILAAGADGIIAKPIMNLHDLGRDILAFLFPAPDKTRPALDAPAPENPGDKAVVERDIYDALIETIGAESTSELLGKLQSDADSVAEGLARGQKTMDLAEIRAQTHILISVAGAIGAIRLQNLAQDLNGAAHHGDTAMIDTLCERCLAGLSELQGFILDEQARQGPAP